MKRRRENEKRVCRERVNIRVSKVKSKNSNLIYMYVYARKIYLSELVGHVADVQWSVKVVVECNHDKR